jgi:hypothetical protein
MCAEFEAVTHHLAIEGKKYHKNLGQDNGCRGRDMNLGLLEHQAEVPRTRLQRSFMFRWQWKCNTVF